MESFEIFAETLRDDANAFATNLTRSPEEGNRLVDHALAEAYARCCKVGPAATPVWKKCVIYRSLLEAAPRIADISNANG